MPIQEDDVTIKIDKASATPQTNKTSTAENVTLAANTPIIKHKEFLIDKPTRPIKGKNETEGIHIDKSFRIDGKDLKEHTPPLDTENYSNNGEYASNRKLPGLEETDFAAIPANYKEIETQEEDRSLYVGNMDLNKDKIKAVFKKAGRLFGDKAKGYTDNGKLQVAMFEFDSNNNDKDF